MLENLTHVAPELNDTQARSILGSFLFSGDDAFKPARVLSGGEKTRLALATLVTSRANVLLLDEPTNNLDPASRDEILKAIAKYEGAIVLVTHDEGAVQALNPERVLLMPDGDEDLWNDSYLDLVARSDGCRCVVLSRGTLVPLPSVRLADTRITSRQSTEQTPHISGLSVPFCVLKCAPERRPCALKHANHRFCVPMFAHSSFDAHLSTQTRLDP